MLKKYTSQNITWIDIERPTEEEVRDLMRQYKLHPLVADELLMPTFKPKVDLHTDYIYLILHFPFLRKEVKTRQFVSKEVDFIVGKDFIITVRYESVNPLDQFTKVFEVDTILNTDENQNLHAGYLFFYITQKLYGALLNELDRFESLQKEMEQYIFNGREKLMVKEISRMGHNLLDFKQATIHHREVLDSLETVGEKLFGRDFLHYLRSVNDKYRKVYHLLKTNQENLKELRETNDSLLTTKQNETMKIFTILAFVTFPLSLFAALFSMNTENTPIIGNNHDFWIILIGMMVGTIFMFAFFKYKKWF